MDSATALSSCSAVTSEQHSYVRMLPVAGEVLLFRCKHARQKDRDSRLGSEITCWRMFFDKETVCFSMRDDRIFPMFNSAREVDIVCCASALDVRRGQKVPCVLLRLCKKRVSAFTYMLYSLVTPAKAELHVEFVLPYEMRDNVTILQGPTLVWSNEDTVFYTSPLSGGVNEIPIHMNVHFIGELPTPKRKIIALGSRTFPEEDVKSQSNAMNVNKNLIYFIEDGNASDGTFMVPDAYSCVIQCVCVVEAKRRNGTLSSVVVAATNRKQLVCFVNGLPRDVCQLPYNEPQTIQMVDTGCSGCLFAITFSHGNVCAVWKDTFQVASCWTGVSLLLVDDFMGYGTDQMLLVFQGQGCHDNPLSSFIITDLCGTTLTSGQPDGGPLSKSDAAQENYLRTVQVLETRLQSGLTMLHDLERECEVKDRVLRQSLRALTDLVSGTPHLVSSPAQEGLVSLWDDEEQGEDFSGEKMQTDPPESPVKVERVWQRILGDHLVFGVMLSPKSTTSLENVSVSILSDIGCSPAPVSVHTVSRAQSVDSCVSQTVSHSSEPPTKETRPPPDDLSPRLAVTGVTDLTPLLTSGSVRYPIMLRYTQVPEQSAHLYQCGQVSLSIKDITQGRFTPQLLKNCQLTTDEAREDLYSLLAAWDCWCFQISCPDHTLVDVGSWLQHGAGCERLAVSPQHLLVSPAGAGTAMLLKWHQSSPFQGLLCIHCSGQLGLLQFLDALCDFLPASHRIQRVRRREGSEGCLAECLQKELLTTIEGVTALLRNSEKEEMESDGGAERGEGAEPLQRRREEWQRDRERCKRRWSPLVDGQDYRRLTLELLKAQQKTDLAALSEAGDGFAPL
ncbi:Fanconi anemia group B protein [Chanos chanos]|uniref:Fanconi anemia group B protein n=1 Tax=Chanos chanos TaxID=29144 RepID=A0A6J2WAR8_CHACN|nr:Fanconi anemia group B protein [Chanos chanos]